MPRAVVPRAWAESRECRVDPLGPEGIDPRGLWIREVHAGAVQSLEVPVA